MKLFKIEFVVVRILQKRSHQTRVFHMVRTLSCVCLSYTDDVTAVTISHGGKELPVVTY